jgi:tRNA dimethylallyltransferase
MPEREKLYQDINERVDLMVADELLKELRRLVADGWAERIRKANVIGYQEMLTHIEGQIELEGAISLIKQNSRRYAKRQFTWFRRQVGGNEFSDIKSLQGALVSALENWNFDSKNLDSSPH